MSKDLLINLSKQIVDKVGFDVISPADKIPFGFKKHTRSISWLAEQVVIQHLKSNREKYNIDVIEESDSDINVWDFRIKFNNGQVISNNEDSDSGLDHCHLSFTAADYSGGF